MKEKSTLERLAELREERARVNAEIIRLEKELLREGQTVYKRRLKPGEQQDTPQFRSLREEYLADADCRPWR